MGSSLDIDDVCAGHPKAQAELDALRKLAAGAVEPLVSDSPYNDLLREWRGRQRTMGRDVASHPATLSCVMDELDAIGPSRAGDCIQSLVFELQVAKNSAEQFFKELRGLSRGFRYLMELLRDA